MSNINSVHNHDYLENSNVVKRNLQEQHNQKEQKEAVVKDALDENLKNTIAKENISATGISIETAEQASQALAEILLKISSNADAPKLNAKLDAYRVNALINS